MPVPVLVPVSVPMDFLDTGGRGELLGFLAGGGRRGEEGGAAGEGGGRGRVDQEELLTPISLTFLWVL